MNKMDFVVTKVTEVSAADGISKGQVEMQNRGKIGKSKINLQTNLDDIAEFALGQFYRFEFTQIAAPDTPGSDTNINQ